METKKIIWLIVGLAVFVMALSVVSFFVYGRFHMNAYPSYPSYPGQLNGFPYRIAYIIMPIMAVISILILILFIRFIMRIAMNGENYSYGEYDRSEAILKERYAKGEISEEQYKTMLNNLKNH